jgi:hypothetical protein
MNKNKYKKHVVHDIHLVSFLKSLAFIQLYQSHFVSHYYYNIYHVSNS